MYDLPPKPALTFKSRKSPREESNEPCSVLYCAPVFFITNADSPHSNSVEISIPSFANLWHRSYAAFKSRFISCSTNGNGLPDDEWYELKGCETGQPTTLQDHKVTYNRPSGPKMDVQWTDSEGQSGKIKYLGAFHQQDYYYPLWVKEDCYTLRGTRLKANNTVDPATGYWANNAFGWGYADNMGSDCLGGNSIDGSGQSNGFKIANAIYPDGTPVKLGYIDFIKVQTGVNAQSGSLGENSTEVFSFQDYFLVNKQ